LTRLCVANTFEHARHFRALLTTLSKPGNFAYHKADKLHKTRTSNKTNSRSFCKNWFQLVLLVLDDINTTTCQEITSFSKFLNFLSKNVFNLLFFRTAFDNEACKSIGKNLRIYPTIEEHGFCEIGISYIILCDHTFDNRGRLYETLNHFLNIILYS
jgi:hypothetical protein